MSQRSSLSKAIEGHTLAPGCGCLPDAAPEKSARKQVLVCPLRGLLLPLPVPEDKSGVTVLGNSALSGLVAMGM